MPLEGRLQVSKSKPKSLADFTNEKQQARHGDASNQGPHRPRTPQGLKDGTLQSGKRSDSLKEGGSLQIMQFGLDLTPPQVSSLYDKIIPPDTMAMSRSLQQPKNLWKRPATLSRSASRSNNTTAKRQHDESHFQAEQEDVNVRINTEHDANLDAFDDTGGLGVSELESSIEEEVTAVLRAKPATNDQYQYHQVVRETDLPGSMHHATQEVLGDNWKQEVADERDYLTTQGRSMFDIRKIPIHRHREDTEDPRSKMRNEQPDVEASDKTPSRPRPVLSGHAQVLGPKPKQVNFRSSPQILSGMTDSPSFRSAEVAQEESPTRSLSRPQSVPPQETAFHQELLQNGPPFSDTPKHGRTISETSGTHGRFANLHLHRQQYAQQKVSAPESETHESSEDEQAQADVDHVPRQDDRPGSASKKRLLEDINALDYERDALVRKTLSELQSESYSMDPRFRSLAHPQQGPSQSMTLTDTLDVMHQFSHEQQREIFRAQNDDEWAQTGQWFVDQFQADLKALTAIRLKRRKAALKIEHEIRKRQRAIEFQKAAVQTELDALQSGGNGLLKDRKPVMGSRCGTPATPARV